MAKKGPREVIKLKSTDPDSKEMIWTYKNKRNTPDRLEIKKFDKKLRKHVVFKEAK